MHNHNNDSKNDGHKGMLWMMIPCLLLLLGFLFLGGGKLSSSEYLWLILIGVCVVPHIWMMFKGRGGHGGGGHSDTDADEKTNGAEESKAKDEHKKGGCCH